MSHFFEERSWSWCRPTGTCLFPCHGGLFELVLDWYISVPFGSTILWHYMVKKSWHLMSTIHPGMRSWCILGYKHLGARAFLYLLGLSWIFFIAFVHPVRYRYHDLMNGLNNFDKTDEEYSPARTDYLITYWWSEITGQGHGRPLRSSLVSTVCHELLELSQWNLHGITTRPYGWPD